MNAPNFFCETCTQRWLDQNGHRLINEYEDAMNNRDISKAPIAVRLLAALEAITARIDGEWDNPSLMLFGALSTDTLHDVALIARAGILANRLEQASA